MGTRDLCRVPPAAARHGKARQCSGTGPCRDCRWVLWVSGQWGQYSRKINSFYRETRSTRLGGGGGRHMAKRSSDPRVAYPKSKFRYGTYRCKLWVLLPPLPHGESVFGGNSFYRAAGTPISVRQGRARQTSGTGPCWDCRRISWVLGPRGQYSGKIRLLSSKRVLSRGH